MRPSAGSRPGTDHLVVLTDVQGRAATKWWRRRADGVWFKIDYSTGHDFTWAEVLVSLGDLPNYPTPSEAGVP